MAAKIAFQGGIVSTQDLVLNTRLDLLRVIVHAFQGSCGSHCLFQVSERGPTFFLF